MDADTIPFPDRFGALQLQFYLRHGLTRRMSATERWYHRISICRHRHPCDACCWEWTGTKTLTGYGQSMIALGNQRERIVHRAVWMLMHQEPIDAGTAICHTCDNRACCNPSHLYPGPYTQKATRPGTRWGAPGSPGWQKGELSPNAKLTEDNVREVWSLWQEGYTQQEIATRFGVTQVTISYVLNRKTWVHVTDAIFAAK